MAENKIIIDEIKKTYNSLSSLGFRKALKNYLNPIDFTRAAEIPAVLNISNIFSRRNEKLKILDISSPQILSAVLANYSDNWDITYINPFDLELSLMEDYIVGLKLKNVSLKKLDATIINSMSKELTSYDYIFSVSVFEHIYPEEGGDKLAIQNVTKFLKPDAELILSIPFYTKRFNEYINSDVYANKKEANKKMFFQRFYDDAMLNTNIIVPSGLTSIQQQFIGERHYYKKNIHKRISKIFGNLFLKHILGRFFFMFAKYFYTINEDFNKLDKPYLAILKMN